MWGGVLFFVFSLGIWIATIPWSIWVAVITSSQKLIRFCSDRYQILTLSVSNLQVIESCKVGVKHTEMFRPLYFPSTYMWLAIRLPVLTQSMELEKSELWLTELGTVGSTWTIPSPQQEFYLCEGNKWGYPPSSKTVPALWLTWWHAGMLVMKVTDKVSLRADLNSP